MLPWPAGQLILWNETIDFMNKEMAKDGGVDITEFEIPKASQIQHLCTKFGHPAHAWHCRGRRDHRPGERGRDGEVRNQTACQLPAKLPPDCQII